MQLPDDLKNKLTEMVQGETLDYQALSTRYRKGEGGFQSRGERLAYLLARMPATFAAVSLSLKELEGEKIESLIDWGAGPAAGFLAARELFPCIKKSFLVERDREMCELGKKLLEGYEGIEWIETDMLSAEVSSSDLALFSYSIGEVAQEKRETLIYKAWETCTWLLIVEPGTPQGSETILQCRELLIRQGACILAPCPHARACPMKWCHFSARLERTRAHRQLKGGELGYEDEKFSYILASKQNNKRGVGRIVRRPQHLSGHVKLTVCAENGLEEYVFSKRRGAAYKWARKAKWGEKCLETVLKDG